MDIAATTWHVSMEWDPPGASLIIECRGEAGAKDVIVLLDGVPAADQPTVYSVSNTSGVMDPDSTMRIAFVPVDDQPRFTTIEILWEDVDGRRRAYATGI